jgi:hypothetical protein
MGNKIGNFIDAGSTLTESNVYYFQELTTPATVTIGVIPEKHLLKSIIIAFTERAGDDVAFDIVNDADETVLPTGLTINPTRQQVVTINLNKLILTDTELFLKFSGESNKDIEGYAIKELIRLVGENE